MTLRHLCAGLVLLATIGSAGCTCCGRNRSTACPAPAVAALPAAPPCCGEPGPVAPVAPVAPGVQNYSVEPYYFNGVR
jgi:hypothetical protein